MAAVAGVLEWRCRRPVTSLWKFITTLQLVLQETSAWVVVLVVAMAARGESPAKVAVVVAARAGVVAVGVLASRLLDGAVDALVLLQVGEANVEVVVDAWAMAKCRLNSRKSHSQ